MCFVVKWNDIDSGDRDVEVVLDYVAVVSAFQGLLI